MIIQELNNAINTIRKNRSFISNMFFTQPQLEKLLMTGGFTYKPQRGLLFIIIAEEGLRRLFFLAQNEEAILEMKIYLDTLGGGSPIVTDCIGREPFASNIGSILERNSFLHYAHFVRLTCKAPKILANESTFNVTYANLNDIEFIRDMIVKEFDPLFAHIPTIDELLTAINKKEIYVVRVRDQIAGLTYFERYNVKYSCLRYYIVQEGYRKKGIGATLLNYEFRNAMIDNTYILWIGTYNTTLNLYTKIGFKRDGLNDLIFVYHYNS